MPHFHKYHGLGNDYLVIDPRDWAHPMDPEAVRIICDRHCGVGSDGILHGPFLNADRISLRIYNPDGSLAEKSGNGVRIFSRYLKEAGYVTDSEFDLTTDGGVVRVSYLDDPEQRIKVDMGTISFLSKDIPVAGPDRLVINEEIEALDETFNVTCLTIGNPHCVVPVEDISEENVCRLGPAFEHHAMFPQRINVQFLKVVDRHNIEIGIWERGAEYTLASGSSSCAATMAAHQLGLVDSPVTVHMPGGKLLIEGNPTGSATMTGPVEGVFSGYFHADLEHRLKTLFQ